MKEIVCFRKLVVACLLTIGFLPFVGVAQSDYDRKIYTAYIKGEISEWEPVIREMEKQSLVSEEEKLELIGYYYGHIGYLYDIGDKDRIDRYIQKGENLINEILNESPDNAAAYSYKGSFVGFKALHNRAKIVSLGTESMKIIRQAYKMDHENALAVAEQGKTLYLAPAIAGGNKKEGIALMEKAVILFENQHKTNHNWIYVDLLVSLGQFYEEMSQYDKALAVYQKILDIEPDFKKVKAELYPACSKKVKQKR